MSIDTFLYSHSGHFINTDVTRLGILLLITHSQIIIADNITTAHKKFNLVYLKSKLVF